MSIIDYGNFLTFNNISDSGVCGRHRKSPFEMISADDALKKIFAVAKQKEEVLDKQLQEAIGYSLAENVKATTPLPPFRASIKVPDFCMYLFYFFNDSYD